MLPSVGIGRRERTSRTWRIELIPERSSEIVDLGNRPGEVGRLRAVRERVAMVEERRAVVIKRIRQNSEQGSAPSLVDI